MVEKRIKNVSMNKEEKNSPTDTNTIITTSLDPYNPPKLTPFQRIQLDVLSNLSDGTVRKEAETDPDCELLGKPG